MAVKNGLFVKGFQCVKVSNSHPATTTTSYCFGYLDFMFEFIFKLTLIYFVLHVVEADEDQG